MKARFNSSIGGLMMWVAVLAVGCAATSTPRPEWLGVLHYTKVAMLVWAAFRARYGRGASAAWWFGFAAMGWGSFAAASYRYGLQEGVGLEPVGMFYPLSPAVTVADRVCSRFPTRPWFVVPYVAEAVRFWGFLILGLAGGCVSQAIDRRRARA